MKTTMHLFPSVGVLSSFGRMARATRGALARCWVVCLLVLAAQAVAAPPSRAAAPNLSASTPPAGGPTDVGELEAYLDELSPALLREHHIAGAAVAVVKDAQ